MNAIGLLTALAAIAPVAAAPDAKAEPASTPARSTLLRTPEAVHEEHLEIHAALQRATREPGRLGATARALSAVLDPHFRREEEIATPPLGLLEPLARGGVTSDMGAVLPMTEALERELDQMLQDHRRIGAARERFEAEARRARRPDYVRLSEALALHARQEEEVLYPAAILVGKFVKAGGR